MNRKMFPWRGIIIIAGFSFVLFLVAFVGVRNSRNAMEAESRARQAEIVVLLSVLNSSDLLPMLLLKTSF